MAEKKTRIVTYESDDLDRAISYYEFSPEELADKKAIEDRYVRWLKICEKHPDAHRAHIMADEIVLRLLRHLGYADVAAAHAKIFMWYS